MAHGDECFNNVYNGRKTPKNWEKKPKCSTTRNCLNKLMYTYLIQYFLNISWIERGEVMSFNESKRDGIECIRGNVDFGENKMLSFPN